LRDEHGYGGGYTVVKDYVRQCRARSRETFVPLAHPPGHAQVDFGEAVGVIGGVRQKVHFFCMDLPQSDACFVKAYPAETTEAFLDGHVSACAFFGAVPTLHRKLQTLLDVGLSYIQLGQSATTLSGGEAQRVKLALELSKRDTGRTLYILDEPSPTAHREAETAKAHRG